MSHSSRFLFVVALAVFCGCSSDDPAPPTGIDAGGASSSSSGTSGSSSPADSGAPALRCTAEELLANDKTDGGAFEITFASGANPRQYDNRCVTVRVGSSVTFAGSFRQHPLQPAGGDSPNPIPFVDQEPPGGKLTVTMPTIGTFGFECTFHPTLMFGAIKVVP